MRNYVRELLRYWELRYRLSKCTTPAERTTVRRSLGQKYKTKPQTPPKRLPGPSRDMEAESREAELRG